MSGLTEQHKIISTECDHCGDVRWEHRPTAPRESNDQTERT
jgi:hypothetical protein